MPTFILENFMLICILILFDPTVAIIYICLSLRKFIKEENLYRAVIVRNGKVFKRTCALIDGIGEKPLLMSKGEQFIADGTEIMVYWYPDMDKMILARGNGMAVTASAAKLVRFAPALVILFAVAWGVLAWSITH